MRLPKVIIFNQDNILINRKPFPLPTSHFLNWPQSEKEIFEMLGNQCRLIIAISKDAADHLSPQNKNQYLEAILNQTKNKFQKNGFLVLDGFIGESRISALFLKTLLKRLDFRKIGIILVLITMALGTHIQAQLEIDIEDLIQTKNTIKTKIQNNSVLQAKQLAKAESWAHFFEQNAIKIQSLEVKKDEIKVIGETPIINKEGLINGLKDRHQNGWRLVQNKIKTKSKNIEIDWIFQREKK